MRQHIKRLVNDALETTSPKLWLSLNILRKNRNYGPEYWLLPQLCRRDAVSLDIGGNRGLFAYYMARLSKQVHVFEPNPSCLAQIAQLRRPNMVIHEFALSDGEGIARMRFDPDNTGVGTIEATNTLTNNPGINRVHELDVPTKRLDSLKLSNVGFIKIDVEGHEPAVLRGGLSLLSACRPTLLLEIELRHNPIAFDEVLSLLDPLNYRIQACTRDGLMPLDRARIAELQSGLPETNPNYVNNFVFLPN